MFKKIENLFKNFIIIISTIALLFWGSISIAIALLFLGQLPCFEGNINSVSNQKCNELCWVLNPNEMSYKYKYSCSNIIFQVDSYTRIELKSVILLYIRIFTSTVMIFLNETPVIIKSATVQLFGVHCVCHHAKHLRI